VAVLCFAPYLSATPVSCSLYVFLFQLRSLHDSAASFSLSCCTSSKQYTAGKAYACLLLCQTSLLLLHPLEQEVGGRVYLMVLWFLLGLM
jgi:hypothetical protein